MSTTTPNREQQRSRQSLLLRFFAPVLALLTLVGVSQPALGQIRDNSLQFNGRTSTGSSAQIANYAGKVTASTTNPHTPYTTYSLLGIVSSTGAQTRPNPGIGTYDLNGTSSLILNGGSLTVSPNVTDGNGDPVAITNVQLAYRVYAKPATPGAAPNTTTVPYNTITLNYVGPYSGANGPVNNTFLYNNLASNYNLLAGLTIGTDYIVEANYVVNFADGSFLTDPNGNYQATFTLQAPPAPTLVGTNAYIAPNGGANIVYNVTPPTPNPFQNANLGTSYDVNTGILLLNGGSASTTEAGANTITNVTLYYRVRLKNTAGGSFLPINLPQTSNSSGAKTFSLSTANINLINGLPNTGDYTLDIFYQASGTNSSNPNNPVPFTQLDNNNNSYYSANFSVIGTPIPSTVWTGGVNDDWFNPGNWDHGVPTAGTNATIRNLRTGNDNAYPNIYAGTTYTYTASNGTKTFIDNTNSGPALARDLTMEGTTQTDRSLLRLQAGQLNVYGNFDNAQLSFIQREYTTINFGGANQTISNGDFAQVLISGSGIKYSLGLMTVSQSIEFRGGLLVTDITRTAASQITLADRNSLNNNQGAQLIGETDDHYLRGFVRTIRGSTTLEDTYTYGSIGMGLVWHATSYDNPNGGPQLDGGNPGSVEVTRNTAEAYNPVANTSGIRRVFGVRPGNPGATTGGLNADMTFVYLDSETKNLGTGGNINIDEDNLVLFRSINSGNTFTNLNRTSINTTTNTLTRVGVTTFATFTLGDRTNPLPVKLVAFDAKRQGNNTLVTWATADETNNAGFEVQVSSDAKTFRKLTFVNSYSNNSSAYQTYSYTDIEAGKSGVRYYRLRQVDLDGKDSYSPVRAVSFATAVAGMASVNIYPNPSTTADQTTLVVQSPVAGLGHLQVMDLTGRTIVSRDITTLAGVTEMAAPISSDLSAGIYIVKITMPSGEVKTTRMQKR